jgi:hypothetical protein
MSRARLVLLALVGLALPVGLALGVYVASEGSLAATPAVLVEPPTKIARAATSAETGAQAPAPTTSTTVDDLPGKCRKPENRLDPDCDPRTAEEDDDSSGHGSGDGDDDSSGSGGGDDDSSGHGSGDDD